MSAVTDSRSWVRIMALASRLLKLRMLWAGPGHIFRWVAASPLWLKLLLGLCLAASIGAAGYYVLHKRVQNRVQRQMMDGWKRFDDAVRQGDKDKMKLALDDILIITPTDELAKQRRATLETGEAARNDPAMILWAMRTNLREKKFPEALREADKWLAREPHDWMAHLVKVAAALSNGDPVTAAKELDALPDPSHPKANLDSTGLLYASQLFRALERDPTVLRNFAQNRVLPFLRTPAAHSRPAQEKIGLIECYLMAFEPTPDKAQPAVLPEAWSSVTKLADAAADEATERLDVPALQRVGRLVTPLLIALDIFHKHNQITAEQFTDFQREIEDRTRRVWQLVRQKEPQSAEAYRSLALSYNRTKDYGKVREQIVQGLEACPDDPELMQLFSRVLQIDGRAWEAWQEMSLRAKQHPDQPVWWLMAIDAAVAANRRDLALEACQEMRKVSPTNRLVTRVEARLWLDAGNAHQAAQLLNTLNLAELARDPEAVQLYVRALADAGLEVQIEPLLEVVEKAADQYNTPQPIVGALRGWMDAKPDLARATKIVARLTALERRWPDLTEMYRIRAEVLFRIAELSTPSWDSVKVAAAVQACERFRAKVPTDRDNATLLMMLRCYGENNPEQAYRDAEPLRTAESDPLLTVQHLEQLGMVYRLNKKLPDAIRLLQRATRSNSATAGCFTQLALAYHANGQKVEARQNLELARVRPRSAREQVDYRIAAQTLQRETP